MSRLRVISTREGSDDQQARRKPAGRSVKAPTAYSQAKAMAAEGPISIALIHRRLGIGYAAAAKLVERLKKEPSK